MIDKNIPIKNIYHMLCYYWEDRWKGFESYHDWDSIKTLDDFLSSLLVSGIDYLYRRGFHRTYNLCTDELPTIRGKVNIIESSKPTLKIRKKVVCDFDDYNADNLFNRIILSTLLSMKKTSENKGMYKELTRKALLFKDIQPIEVTKESFNTLTYDRNNMGYRMLLKLCEFYWSNKMSTEDKGKHKFVDFNNDNRLEKLFEKFLLKFYDKHFHQFNPKASSYSWKLSSSSNHYEYLERLKTDITLTNNENKHILIIDGKYYAKTLVESKYGSGIRNDHVAQVYAYIHNHPNYGNSFIQGMLIYPRSDIELHTVFPLEGGYIYINTVDLSKDWMEVENQLKSFISVMR